MREQSNPKSFSWGGRRRPASDPQPGAEHAPRRQEVVSYPGRPAFCSGALEYADGRWYRRPCRGETADILGEERLVCDANGVVLARHQVVLRNGGGLCATCASIEGEMRAERRRILESRKASSAGTSGRRRAQVGGEPAGGES